MSDCLQNDPEMGHLKADHIPYDLECRLRIRDTIKLAMESHMNPPQDPSAPELKCSQCNGPFFSFGGFQGPTIYIKHAGAMIAKVEVVIEIYLVAINRHTEVAKPCKILR